MSGHFGHWNKRVSTNTEWLPVAGAFGELVNQWSARHDLVVTVHEEAGRGLAAALFDPVEARIEINTKESFGELTTPEDVGDIREKSSQYAYAQAVGAAFHEACHARFTTFDIKDTYNHLTFSEQRALMNLEESRIEKHGISYWPKNLVFLRSCIMNMVMADTKDPKYKKLSRTRQAAHTMALTLARVDTGVLKPKNVKAIRAEIDALLDQDLQKKYRALWLEFQAIANPQLPGEVEHMYRIAREWDKLTQDEALRKGEGSEEKQDFIVIFIPGPAPENDFSGGEPDDDDGPMVIAIYEDQKHTEIDTRQETFEQESTEEAEARAADREAKGKEKEQHQQVAQKVFRGNEKPGVSAFQLETQRAPTTEERIAAVRISQALDKAKYRDRVRRESYNEFPPGRIKTRTMVTAAANKANNVFTKTEPFRRTRHIHVDDPDLAVGIMVDRSGSMSSAMNQMGAAAWIMAEAVHRIQGKTAMVYYGAGVTGTLAPGQRLPQVNIYNCPDGYEKFNEGFQALDGGLDLLNGSGARLLVIVSDGQYRTPEMAACRKWLQRCRAQGVGVLWLGFGYSDEDAKVMAAEAGASFVKPGKSVTDSAVVIGQAAATALTNAGAGR